MSNELNNKEKGKTRATNAFNTNKDDMPGKSSLFEFGIEQFNQKNRKIKEQSQ